MPTEIETPEVTSLRNQRILSLLSSDDGGMNKTGSDALNAFTRTTLREDSFVYKIIEPLDIPDEELTMQVHTEKPCKVLEREPGLDAAISIGFGQLPSTFYMKANRWMVEFSRLMSRRALKDIIELRTSKMDLRQVFTDNMTKDMMAEVDGRFLTAVHTALIGVDVDHSINRIKPWQTVSGGVTRETIIYGLDQVMPTTPYRLSVHSVLCNTVFLAEIAKFGRNEMGGDFSQDLMLNGWVDREFHGKRWIATIKRDLVEDGRVYGFADPRAIGKMFLMEKPTLHVKKEAFLLDYFLYMCIGGGIGNTSGLIILDFDV